MIVPGGLALALILYVVINIILAAKNAATFPKYWQDKAAEPVPADAIRLVAMAIRSCRLLAPIIQRMGVPAALHTTSNPELGDQCIFPMSALAEGQSRISSTSSSRKLT